MQSVSNFILTLSDTTLHTSAFPPAVGQLSALHASATESLRWLRKCLARLGAALRGAKQTQETILTAAAKEIVDPHGFALPLSRWAELVATVVQGLETDLEAKREIVASLQHTVERAYVMRDQMERGVATWLEQPLRTPGDAELLLAAFEAEADQDVATSSSQQMQGDRPANRVEHVDKAESPALVFLKEAGRRKKG